MPTPPSDLKSFESLKEVIRILRSQEGCPWDREQTNISLTKYAIEEVSELVEAIEAKSIAECKDELGDVLLQVMLHSQIYSEDGHFEISDVIENLNQKMIRRHPHVFSDQSVESSDQVSSNWEEIKRSERANAPQQEHPDQIKLPKVIDALQIASKLGKTTREHFDWSNATEVLKKVEEEFNECHQAIKEGDSSAIESEIGDLLFSIAQWARHLKVDPNKALRATNRRFVQRYNLMIELITADQRQLGELNDSEKNTYWERAKSELPQ